MHWRSRPEASLESHPGIPPLTNNVKDGSPIVCTRPSQIKSWGHRCGALPGWLAIFEAEGQRFATLEYFACERQIRSVLLDLGAGDFNLVVGFERHAHVVEKFLGTKKDMHGVGARAILHYQVSDGLADRKS